MIWEIVNDVQGHVDFRFVLQAAAFQAMAQ